MAVVTIVNTAIAVLLNHTFADVQRTSERFEQKLENLDMPLCLREVFTPRIEAVTSKQKTVSGFVFV